MKKQTRNAALVLGVVAILALVFSAGCAFYQAVDTPEKRALAMLKTWNGQYDDTLSLAKQCQAGECSADQKNLVRKKKAWLKLLKPVVDLYVTKVQSGATVPDTVEQAILQLINKLVAGVELTGDTQTDVDNLINQLVKEVE